MSRLRARVIGIAVVSACGFTATNMQHDDARSSIDSSMDAYIPDASACLRGSAECIANGQMVRVCDAAGQQPHDEPCAWSCLDTPTPHCGKLVPSGGAVTTADLDQTTLGDTQISGTTVTINTDDGSITGGVRPAGIGSIMNGIDVTQRGSVTVFRFNKLTVNALTLAVRGNRAAALVSLTDITINGEIDAQGDCTGRSGGPGGGSGGASKAAGNGSGGGGSGSGDDNDCSGGGGGGYGGAGGNGGAATNAGSIFGMATIPSLAGGGGGGGGGGNMGGDGGGGGGAIQLAANGRITINGLSPFGGGINAGGCGGRTGNSCGGGGGAGGTILIEAPVIELKSSTLAVNGGAGAGGGGGTSGERANFSTSKASGGRGGGPPGQSAGNGGDGADDNTPTGGTGTEDNNKSGGGGAGVGRMRFNTLSGSIVMSGMTVFSPGLTTSTQTTTVSRGMAVIK